jgi:hypothetical protein
MPPATVTSASFEMVCGMSKELCERDASGNSRDCGAEVASDRILEDAAPANAFSWQLHWPLCGDSVAV